jgi:hypothetical protein
MTTLTRRERLDVALTTIRGWASRPWCKIFGHRSFLEANRGSLMLRVYRVSGDFCTRCLKELAR